METLKSYMQKIGIDDALYCVVLSLADAIKLISKAVRVTEDGKAGTKNIFGEEQIKLDVVSENIVQDVMKKNSDVGVLASEELPEEMIIGDGEYAICYDPLDGSSLVDVNLTVGSIFGIYKTNKLIGMKGDDQLGAIIALYGPKTTLFLTLKKGVVYFVLNEEGEFVLAKENIKVSEEGKMFAPGNLRACKSRQEYLNLLNYWCKEQYTLRYSGGMVPDIAQILLKDKGIFTYPGYDEAPDGKLRIMFECAPMSLLMEQAGGVSTDGKTRILEKEFLKLDQRTPIFIGGKEEVNRAVKFFEK